MWYPFYRFDSYLSTYWQDYLTNIVCMLNVVFIDINISIRFLVVKICIYLIRYNLIRMLHKLQIYLFNQIQLN